MTHHLALRTASAGDIRAGRKARSRAARRVLVAGLALPLMAATPAVAAGPDAADALSVALTEVLPAQLRQMRLTQASGGDGDVILIAQPAIGGPLPLAGDAAKFLCDQPAVSDFLDQGGVIRVLMIDKPFLTLSSCEGP